MFGRSNVSKALFAVFIIACLTAACALNMASSKLSSGDRLAVAGFPKRVGVATLAGSLTAHEDATNHLSRGLVDLGFQVVARSWDVDKILRYSAEGIFENIPENIRKKLEEAYGLQGIFIGTLSQDRGNLISETRLSLRLISVSTGKLIWSTNVLGGGVTGLSGGVKETATAAVGKALQSLEKDLYPAPKKPNQKPSTLTLKKSQSEKLD